MYDGAQTVKVAFWEGIGVEKVDSREEKRDIKTNNTKAGESSGIVRNLKKEAAEKWKNTHLVSEDAVT